MRSGKSSLLALSLFLILTAPAAASQEGAGPQLGPARELTDIIYPGALSPGKATGPVAGMASVIYTVREKYPSTTVLEFYDRELAKRGYVPYAEPHLRDSDRKWTQYIKGTLPGDPNVRELGAHWVDRGKKKRVLLILRHYEFKDAAGKYREAEGQEVILQVYDFFELPKRP